MHARVGQCEGLGSVKGGQCEGVGSVEGVDGVKVKGPG